MSEKTYTMRLTAKEIYYLREAFDASFTEPESQNATERSLAKRLQTLASRSFNDSKAAR